MRGKASVKGFIKYLMVIILIAAPLAVIAQSKKDRNQAKKLQEQADQAYLQKNYRQAADAYGKSIALVPNNAYAHYQKGFAHFKLDENDQAVSEFTTALNQGFKPFDIYRVRGFIYYGQKNYDAALDDINKGLAIDPKDLIFLKAKGEISLDRRSFPDALDAFQRAAQVAPGDADVQYHLARIYFETGDTKAQAAAAETALARGTKYPAESYYLLADAERKQNLADAALNAYKRAINAKPDMYLAYINLADLYRGEYRFNDAIAISKQALQIFPANKGELYTALSWYYSLAGRPEDAVEAAKAGIIFLPDQYLAYTNLCRAYNDLKKYSDAVTACSSALRLKPGDGETNYYIGNAFVGLGKSVEATGKYSKAVAGLLDYTAKNPEDSDGWYLLGNASFADKQLDQAIDAYLRCLAISPKFLKARVNLGIAYTRKKNRTGAMVQYNLLLSADAALAAKLKAEIDKM